MEVVFAHVDLDVYSLKLWIVVPPAFSLSMNVIFVQVNTPL